MHRAFSDLALHIFAISILLIASTLSVCAQTVMVEDRSINLAIPKGYCPMGQLPADSEIINTVKRGIGSSNRVLALFAECSELARFRSGQQVALDNFGQVLVPSPTQGIRTFRGVSRAEFIRRISQSNMFTKQFNTNIKSAQERVGELLPSLHGAEGLGILTADESGLYVGVLAELVDSQSARKIVGVTALTLIKDVPLTINLYTTYRNASISLEQLISRQKANLQELIRLNQ